MPVPYNQNTNANSSSEKLDIEKEINNFKSEEIQALFTLSDKELVQKLLAFNNLEELKLSGVYSKSKDGRNFGFFNQITDLTGKQLRYPFKENPLIDSIFVLDPTLVEGEAYYFKCNLADRAKRKEKENPFHLTALRGQIEKGERLTFLTSNIREKEAELNNIIQTGIERKDEVAKLESLLLEKGNEIQQAQNQLIEIREKKNNMEKTINIIKHRLALCKNLGFLDVKEIKQYIDIIDDKKYLPQEGYLDFENDLELNYSHLAEHIQAFLFYKENLIYTRYQINNFLTLLRTNDLIVLSGLSGSGKTQIVKSFAKAIGGVAKIIPVKPNWTSSDDLLGYYNPIQMSFLPTPFTEAIIEAKHNPNKLYLICLDEMNLARAEYYFADFLSKLEDRKEQPRIELYAKHEEELFLSEFSSLLNMLESAMGEMEINDWRDFLENDKSRQRFFDLLGKTDNESTLSIHAKMRRRLIDLLKFPSDIEIPKNIRFIGAINVDETTHYFSPKILDRIHLVRFENPLLLDLEQIKSQIDKTGITLQSSKPIYIHPDLFTNRSELPQLDDSWLCNTLKQINKTFLIPLNIDFGVRSIRQSINYSNLFEELGEKPYTVLNSIVMQKILPRFVFDSNDYAKMNGENKKKIDVLVALTEYVENKIAEYYNDFELWDENEHGKNVTDFMNGMVERTRNNENTMINFWS